MTSTSNETPDKPFEQADEFIIRDLETLKVVADPLRLQIIEIIFDHPHTVKQIAASLQLPPSKLYYHINLLEKHGLISVAGTRIVSGIIERSYQTSALHFRVMRGLLTPQRTPEERDAGVALFVDAILDDAKEDIKQNARSGLINLDSDEHALSLRIARVTSRLTPEQAVEFQNRLSELIQEFQSKKEDGANRDEQGYALITVMYPTKRGNRPLPDQ